VTQTALDRPILITGTPRSGKTVVRRIMEAAREFVCVEEPLMIWSAGMGVRSDDRRGADDATPEVTERIRRDCAQLVRDAGKARYLDDLSYHALRVPFVRAVMPECKIIHVVRDGESAIPELLFGWTFKDSVSGVISRRRKSIRLRSLPVMAARFARNYAKSRLSGRRATWGPRVPGLAEFSADHPPALIAAFQWSEMVRVALDDLERQPSKMWLQVRLEDLIADPAGQTGRITDFCEVEEPDRVIEHAKGFVDPAYTFEKRVNPTDAQWEQIRDLIRPVQARLDEPN
jgi:Sulfotransferase family